MKYIGSTVILLVSLFSLSSRVSSQTDHFPDMVLPEGGIPVAFTSDGSRLLSITMFRSAQIIDTQTGRVLIEVEHSQVTHAIWNPQEDQFATSGWDNQIFVWDATTGDQLLRFNLVAADSLPAWSEDGHFMLVSFPDQVVRMFDAYTGEELLWFEGTFSHWMHDRRQILTWKDDLVQIWDVESDATIFTREFEHGTLRDVDWNYNENKLLLSDTETNSVEVWDTIEETLVATLEHDEPVYEGIFSPNGEYILTQTPDYSIHVWELEANEQISLLRHSQRLDGAMWHPSEPLILTWTGVDTIYIWNALTGNLIHRLGDELSEPKLPGSGATWLASGSFIVQWTQNANVQFWNAQTGQLMCRFRHLYSDGSQVHEGSVTVALQEEEHILATGFVESLNLWSYEACFTLS